MWVSGDTFCADGRFVRLSEKCGFLMDGREAVASVQDKVFSGLYSVFAGI